VNMPGRWASLSVLLLVLGCEQPQESVAPLYETAPVEKQDIEVSVTAAGVVEPQTTVDVKSKASGEILAVHAETGDRVDAGALLVEIDERVPRNALAEAQASLKAAQAREKIADTQMKRAETLFDSGTLTQTDYEQAQLEFANAQAQVVSTQVALENAKIAMEDTDVRAPITGTVIEKHVEPGTVISSPTRDVSGGTLLLRMADLSTVQVRALVDETDIGKLSPGMGASVTVAAFPNQPFHGEVLKIEPQAVVEQNVTMFAVLIRLDNQSGLLKPGMNADVEISIAERSGALAVPTMALRTPSDIPATAAMLGIDAADLRRTLRGDSGADAPRPHERESIAVGGRDRELPAGVDAAEVSALLAKRRSGVALTAEDRALLEKVFRRPGAEQGSPAARDVEAPTPARGGPGRPIPTTSYQFGGDYWVVAMRGGEPTPVSVRTGLTDLRYSEIVAGLNAGDQVLLLPSASLFEQQERLQTLISRRFSSNPFQGRARR
jgi:HlyD family secretion protein